MFNKLKELIKKIIELANKCEEKQPVNPIVEEKVAQPKIKKKKKAQKKSKKKKK
jgi:hypothetical protein